VSHQYTSIIVHVCALMFTYVINYNNIKVTHCKNACESMDDVTRNLYTYI